MNGSFSSFSAQPGQAAPVTSGLSSTLASSTRAAGGRDRPLRREELAFHVLVLGVPGSDGPAGDHQWLQALELPMEAARILRELGVDIRLRLRESGGADLDVLRWADAVVQLRVPDKGGPRARALSSDALIRVALGAVRAPCGCDAAHLNGGTVAPECDVSGPEVTTSSALAQLWLAEGTGSSLAG